MENLENQNKEEKSSNKLFQIVAAILFVLAAILGWQFLEQKSLAEQEKTEKESVQEELSGLLVEYQNLSSDNERLNSELRSKEEEIKEMLSQIEKMDKQSKEQAWLMSKYKKESKTLRRLLKGYLKELDSLGKTIIVLEEEKTMVETNLTKEKEITQKLTQEKEGLTQQVAIGSKFKLHNLTTIGIRLKGGNREKQETRARKVEKLKTCFTVGANELAKPGERNIYIRVADANGDVFPKGGDSSLVFIYEEKEIVYSSKRLLNYQNQPADVCLYFQRTLFEPGKYTVDIFADGVQIGESLINLE